MNHPFLSQLSDQLNNNIQQAKSIIEGKSNAQLTWKPAVDRWSICECFGHLLQTHYEYKAKITEAIENGRQKGITDDAAYKPGWFARKFIGWVGPDPSFKLKAPGAFQPRDERKQDVSVCQELIGEIQKLQEILRQSDGLHLNKNKLASPITSLLKFTLGEALELQVKHQQRHLNQAQRVAEESGFPK